MTLEVYDIRYERLRKSIDGFLNAWRNGTRRKLGEKLPSLTVGNKSHSISEVEERSDGVYIRVFNGMYTRWKRLAPTDEIVFNDINYKLMWAQH